MIPLAAKLARFWKKDRTDLSRAVQDVIVFNFNKPLSREAAKERYRG
jgi:hypothetical protein